MTEATPTTREIPCDSESNADSLRIENELLKKENERLRRAVARMIGLARDALAQFEDRASVKPRA